MSDPLGQIVTLLQPTLAYSKIARGAGRWVWKREKTDEPFYCAILSGGCRLTVDGYPEIELEEGDFVLIPAAPHFTMASLVKSSTRHLVRNLTLLPNGDYLVGEPDAPKNVRALIGYCAFASSNADLLVSLLPRVIRLRTQARMETLLHLVRDEFHAQQPARDVVLTRLLEVLFIEALRSSALTDTAPSLLRGLADERVSAALRAMHNDPSAPWAVTSLAREAALSRSAFFERFTRVVGVAPMEYVLRWRMALAKDLLRTGDHNVADVAQQVGYSSASTFTVAFTRHVGQPPARYARAPIAGAP